jgi:hypothetical protein
LSIDKNDFGDFGKAQGWVFSSSYYIPNTS